MSANAANAWRRSFRGPLDSMPRHKKENPYTRTLKKTVRPISTRKRQRKKSGFYRPNSLIEENCRYADRKSEAVEDVSQRDLSQQIEQS